MATDPIAQLARAPALALIVRALGDGRHAVATGSVGSSTTIAAMSIAESLERPVVLVVAHPDDADEAEAELTDLRGPDAVLTIPALEASPGESGVAAELAAARLAASARLLDLARAPGPCVVVAPIAALMQGVPPAKELPSVYRVVARGDTLDPSALLTWLGEVGYVRVDAVEEPGHVAVRGGIVDIYPPPADDITGPIRLDFFGDDVDAIFEIDLDTMGSDRKIDRVTLAAVDPEKLRPNDRSVCALELVPENAVAILHETQEVVEQGRGYFERVTDQRGLFGPPRVLKILNERFGALAEINQFSAGAVDADVRAVIPVESLPAFERDTGEAFKELAELAVRARIVVACQNEGETSRARELIEEHAPDAQDRIELIERYVHRGFVWDDPEQPEHAFALVPYHELLHRFDARRRTGRLKAGRTMDTFVDIAPGDYVVHAEHGIARFAGLTIVKPKPPPKGTKRAKDQPEPEPEEFATLEFAGSSKLHVPCAQIDLIQKYVGGFSGKPPLSTLGGTKWKTQKARVAESVRDLAGEMLRVRAAREAMPGIRYPADTPWQNEFEAEFPYDETEDQLAALAEIKRDMHGPRPMDRLVCGDVGFGKTELAIRAAFKACEFGKQVAVLVPTTVLAEQHERTFSARFADYPFRVESLSRFKTTKEINATLRDLRKGEIDVVIGTHRLLSKDVRFSDLGLVVIDEEQRFGVEHKERLLQLRLTVDVLTLSATPIPRTLHMAMLGLRDISSLTTPPADRRAIVTEVIPYNERRIEAAITRELAREGQIYFVHNRVHDIKSVADDVQKLAPEARIVVGHGQMAPKELEAVMLKFMRRQADILVSTTIIESGVDIPTANTMVINDADRFGLADLHQLRGRVGRYKHRAYCYMLLPEDRTVKEVAKKRLKAIEQYSMLGAGFKIAMRDLEIRGAGNLLGAEQSGHIAAVGYDMYCRLLDQAVGQLSDVGSGEPIEHVSIDLGMTGIIPKPYIPSEQRRLEAYRRIATATSQGELDQVEADLTSAYGEPPKATARLLELAAVRTMARSFGVRTIAKRGERVVFLTEQPGPVADCLREAKGSVAVVGADLAQTNARTPSGVPLSEVYWTPPPAHLEPSSLVAVLRRRLTAAPGSSATSPSIGASAS